MRTLDPWEGKLYRTDGLFGVKLLILGEAHYAEPKYLLRSFTIDCVRDLGQRRRFRFYTATRSLVLGTRGWVSDAERAAFWDRVAFCNFIQSFPGTRPRIPPTPEMWAAGREAFLLTVTELEPKLVVVLGERLSRHLPDMPVGVQLCGVRHPSGRGFRLDVWQPIVRAAIAAVGGKFPIAEPSSSLSA